MYCFKRISVIVLCAFIFVMPYAQIAFCDGTDEPVMADVSEYADINGKAAVVMEAATGQVLYAKNEDEKLPVTHLVKLMTLLLVSEAIDSGKFTTETMHTVSNHANSMGDPQIWLNVGEKISTDELIKSITIGNANDGCVVLAEAIAQTEEAFVEMMNAKADELSMVNTNFVNCSGIHSDQQYSTARDIAILSSELRKHTELEQYFLTWMEDIRDGQTNIVNTNRLIRSYNGITGMKAAASAEAGNCLVATAVRKNLDLVCVVLGCHTSDDRFSDAKSLLDTAFSLYVMFEPEVQSEVLEPMPVTRGQKLECSLEVNGCTCIAIERGKSEDIDVVVSRNEELEAPVFKGQIVGKISYYIDDELLLETDIVTSENVKRINMRSALVKLLEKLLKF